MKKNRFRFLSYVTFSLVIASFISCGGEKTHIPKPMGYFRIDLPEKKYVLFDSSYPYTFEYPVYAKINPDINNNTESYWLNIDFPKFKGKIHLSYKPIKRNLSLFADDAYNLAMKHIPKASNIEDSIIDVKENKVYGIIYNIEGDGTASTYQFYVSDSISNFVRGALYFNVHTNNDSLAPVINFIKQDINHLISTLKWKKV